MHPERSMLPQRLLIEHRDRDAMKCRIARLRDHDVGQLPPRATRDPCRDLLAELSAISEHRRRENLYTIEGNHGAIVTRGSRTPSYQSVSDGVSTPSIDSVFPAALGRTL